MKTALVDSELKVMNIIWRNGDMPAREVARRLTDTYGWNMNTTYTLIKRCIKKGAVQRVEPNFICHALVAREQVQEQAARDLVDKIFDGSAGLLFASLLNGSRLSPQELQSLREQIDRAEKEAAL